MEDKDNRNCNQLQLVEHTQKFFLTNLTLYFTSLNEFIYPLIVFTKLHIQIILNPLIVFTKNKKKIQVRRLGFSMSLVNSPLLLGFGNHIVDIIWVLWSYIMYRDDTSHLDIDKPTTKPPTQTQAKIEKCVWLLSTTQPPPRFSGWSDSNGRLNMLHNKIRPCYCVFLIAANILSPNCSRYGWNNPMTKRKP